MITDKNTKKWELPREIEKELEYQYAAGENFFNHVVRKIIHKADEERRRVDEEEAPEGGSSEDSES